MQLLDDAAGTSWALPACLRDDPSILLSPLLPVSAIERDSLEVSSLHAIWNLVLEKATRVEANALKRFVQRVVECDIRDGSLFSPGNDGDWRSIAIWALTSQSFRARLGQLQATLRAKLIRRLVADSRGRKRLSLDGSFNCVSRETGSAAATARRMFPLGAPPFEA